jgi:hypothetical protein
MSAQPFLDYMTGAMSNPEITKYLNQLKNIPAGINVPGAMLPWTKQINFKLMSTPAKLFLLVTAAVVIIETLMRTWAMWSLRGQAPSAAKTWMWINTILSVLGAIAIAIVTIVIINTLQFTGHKVIAWVLALLPIIMLVGLLIISPTIIDIVLDMISGKDLAASLASVFPNAANKLNTWLENRYSESQVAPSGGDDGSVL